MGEVYGLCQPQEGEQVPPTETAAPVRVFVGVKIAPEIARQLAEFAAPLNWPSVRRVATDDIHLTLVPPWNEAFIAGAVEKLRGVAAGFGAFWLSFQRISYGPQPRRPRLLWVDCESSDAIVALRAALLEACGQTDERPFQPHVTLVRIRSHGPAIARKHPIDQPLSFMQHVEAIEFFQSPPQGATGYRVLASLPLGKSQ